MTGTSVLVTGAAGFVGRRVVHALTERGFRVTGLDLPQVAFEHAGPAVQMRMVGCDLLEDAAVAALAGPQRYDAIVHLAGVLPGRATRSELFAVNAGATSAVLEHLAAPGCHVVLFSTGLVYGSQPAPFVETLPCAARDAYAQSKLAAEALVQAWGLATAAAVTVLRPSVLYGAGAPAGMLLLSLLRALRAGELFEMTAGEQLRDFLHVDDAAEAVARVLERRAAGTFNLAAGESTSVRRAAELAAAIAGRPELLRLGALPYRAHEVFDYRFDAGALRRAVDWSPRVDLTAGLTRLLQELS